MPACSDRSIRRVLFASLLLGAAGGCDSLLDPGGIEGLYVLERLDGARLPTRVWTGAADQWTLLADTLTIESNRLGLIRTILRREPGIGGTEATIIINNTRIEFETQSPGKYWLHERFGCLDAGNCVPPESFAVEFTGGDLTVHRREGVGRYRRVSRAP